MHAPESEVQVLRRAYYLIDSSGVRGVARYGVLQTTGHPETGRPGAGLLEGLELPPAATVPFSSFYL